MTLHPLVAVLTADESRALDARAIVQRGDSYALMRTAAERAAEWLGARSERSAAVYVGSGNNGGDGWLVAGMLRAQGWQVRVLASGEPKTDDARRARSEAESDGLFAPPTGDEALLIDAVLGTGCSGDLRGSPASVIAALRHAAANNLRIVIALDIPSGMDATTAYDGGAVAAVHTLSFGAIKRAHLLRRDLVGALHVLDIGLPEADDSAPRLVDAAAVYSWIAPLAPDVYKSTRGRLAICGGESGMAGAVILAARGAHASGVGMVRCDVSAESVLALQIAAPFATVSVRRDDAATVDAWPHAMVIGPGLDGSRTVQRSRILTLLRAYHGPVVLDAGALTAFAATSLSARNAAMDADFRGDDAFDSGVRAVDELRSALGGRPALLTPHLGEFARLSTIAPSDVDRWTDPSRLAAELSATVLLKGVPTIIAAPDGTRYVTGTGNPALAMGGSGDLLSGIAGALLAQGMPPLRAGAAAAWVHGTAAERAAAAHGAWRGVTMEMLTHELGNVSAQLAAQPTGSSHSLLHLPAVPQR
jgi:ADP-dependent NAD(P)H-hydrate dehydratase / NAD(P)H-hydrate epimerase